DGIWFNNYVIPARMAFEWSKWSAGLLSLFQSALLTLVLFGWTACLEFARRRPPAELDWDERGLLSIAVIALGAAIPLCLYFYLAPGASGNSFAPILCGANLVCMWWTRQLL